MAESVISIAVEHIANIVKKETNVVLCDLGSEAKAVCEDLEEIKEKVVEAQQMKKTGYSELFQSLLAQLRRIAYDAEDVVDTYVSETESGVSLINSLSLGLVNYPRAHQASKKLRRLRKQVQEVNAKLDKYKEGSTSSIERRPVRRSQSSKGHREAYDDCIVGIEEDVKKLVMMLVSGRKLGHDYNEYQDASDADTDIDINVLAIVGMGGSGKTTLARSIYNHRIVQKYFKHRAWVTPMRGWGASEVLSEISKEINRNTLPNIMITKSPCLVVLDDVWDWEFLRETLPKLIQYNEMNELCKDFKIVFTSRQHLQPFESPSLRWHFHETQLLSQDNSWVLFNKVSTSNSHGKELAKEYKSLATEMLKKCGGLPLAIVALSSFLKTKDSIQEWEKVFSQLVGKEGPHLYRPVNDILALSYDDLPNFLKPFFLYIGLFREDSTISSEKLKRMWIAEGFVQRQCRIEETFEDAAKRLLQILIDNTMVQVVKRTYAGKPKALRIHDIMRDLCIIKAQELDFLTVYSDEMSQNNSRRAAINLSKWSTLPIENPHLRSLLLYGPGDDRDKHASIGKQQANLNLALVCEKFKLLRVLDIKGIKTSDGTMPKELGNLIHLRYLRIRSTNIRELPKSIGKLRKLLTLDYWNVSSDHYGIILPNVLWKLRHLRHLYLPYETNNSKEDFKLHTMKDLQTLCGVRGGNWMLKEMPSLSSNLRKLNIQGISSSTQMKSLFSSPMITKHDHLYSLALDWYGFMLELGSLEALCWKQKLQKLRLMGKVQENMPLKLPSNLKKLELYFTQLKESKSMEALGKLDSLKYLTLAKDSYIGSEWIICSENAFPKLEEFKLRNLQKLVKWEIKIRKGTMPCLRKLSIVSCTSLKYLSEGLKSITTLDKLKIERMPTNFNIRLRKIKESDANKSGGGEDFHIVENIRNVVVQDSCTPLFS
ncbi:putative disease resistance RPP8-like protein 4 [Bienertia sinuspersici]